MKRSASHSMCLPIDEPERKLKHIMLKSHGLFRNGHPYYRYFLDGSCKEKLGLEDDRLFVTGRQDVGTLEDILFFLHLRNAFIDPMRALYHFKHIGGVQQ